MTQDQIAALSQEQRPAADGHLELFKTAPTSTEPPATPTGSPKQPCPKTQRGLRWFSPGRKSGLEKSFLSPRWSPLGNKKRIDWSIPKASNDSSERPAQRSPTRSSPRRTGGPPFFHPPRPSRTVPGTRRNHPEGRQDRHRLGLEGETCDPGQPGQHTCVIEWPPHSSAAFPRNPRSRQKAAGSPWPEAATKKSRKAQEPLSGTGVTLPPPANIS